MKRILTIVAVIAAVVALALIISSSFGKKYDESDVNREVSIRWEMVNLREDYSTDSDVIVKLCQGETVFLTGYSYEYFGAEDVSTQSWREVRTESGLIGWVVTESILWH